ncbi:MAG: NAD-dependent epimerase/dehydratase family protein, partial [Gemmatimonadota bacterium]
ESALPPQDGLRFLHMGSAFEYGSVEGAVSEGTSCRPQSDYAETKLDGTGRLVKLHAEGLPVLVLRVATVYGSGEHPHRLLPTLIRAAQTGETLSFTAGEQERDFTYITDVAEGLVRVLAKGVPPWPVANLATGRLHQVREFVGCAQEMLRLRPDQVALGGLPYRPDEVWQGPIDTSRLDSWLGWRPAVSIETGIRATIADS